MKCKKDREQKQASKRIVMTEEQFNDFSDKMFQQAINGINTATINERKRKLSEFSTPALEAELLSRQKCQINRLTCTQQAEE